MDNAIKAAQVHSVAELGNTDLEFIVEQFKNVVKIPSDPWQQLVMVVEAMLKSWHSER